MRLSFTMKKAIHINIDRKYLFPLKLSVVRYKDKILVISVNTATWLVFDNEEQLRFFELLKENTIRDAIKIFNGCDTDFVNVITQIEAKKFEDTHVIKSPEGDMHLYLTNNCNMHCPHCYMFAGTKLKDELTTIEVKNLLKAYSEHGKIGLTISGGEATTRKDFLEIVEYASSVGLKVQLLTNGYMLSDEFIDKLSPLLYRIQISIDGYSEEENSKVRNKGSFMSVLHSIDRFVKNNVKTEIAITPYLDETLSSKTQKYADFGKSLADKYKDYDFMVKYTTGLIDGRNTNLNDAKREFYRQTMNEVTNLYYGRDVSNDSFIASCKNKRIYDNCTYGRLSISANGDVFACSRVIGIKPYANVRTHSFDYIWKMSKKAESLSNICNLAPCNTCDLMYICGGNCRIKYFPFFKNCDNFEKVPDVISRKCDSSVKNSFYELMIKTNKKIYQ